MKLSQFKWTAAFVVWTLAITAIIGTNLYSSIPAPQEMKGCFVARMNEVEFCPKGSKYVPFSQISDHLKHAILVSEDAGFYHHGGFEFDELKESFKTNLLRGSFARGGSTITQQLARNLFLTSEKSLLRKVKEALITYRLEQTFKKNEILERYLNVVEFGKNIYGVGAAARHYFAKAPADLTVLESAYLAFLLPSPVKYSASFSKGLLTKFGYQRIHQILFRLAKYQHISPDEYQASKNRIKSFPWKNSDAVLATILTDTLPEDSEEPPAQDMSEDELGLDTITPLGINDPEEI